MISRCWAVSSASTVSSDEQRTELLIIMTPYIVRKPKMRTLLNQIETQRMSWCLADVVDVHGDVGTSAGGVSSPQVPTQVIYPTRRRRSMNLLPRSR